MVSIDVKQRQEVGVPFLEIVRAECDDGETFESKFGSVGGAIFFPHRDNAAADSWGVTISGSVVTVQLIGTTTNVTGTLMVWGNPG